MTEEAKVLTLQERMLAAIKANDVSTQEAIAAELVKARGARLQAENIVAIAEATALAGKREALAAEIHKLVKGMKLDKGLTEVKSWGFTYKVDNANPNEPGVVYKAVSLTTATLKAVKTGTTGTGRKGGLAEDFEKFSAGYNAAHPGQDIAAELAAALEKDKTVTNQGFSYAVKSKVRKWAIAQGLLQPVK